MMGLGLWFLVALSPEQRDALPLPRYLDEAALRVAVDARMPAWQACATEAPAGAQTGTANLEISSDGTIRAVSLTGELPPAFAACWSDLARGLDLPAHDEDSVHVSFAVAVAGGAVHPPVRIFFEVRPTDPLYLFVADDADPADRAHLLQILGLSSGPGEPPVPHQ